MQVYRDHEESGKHDTMIPLKEQSKLPATDPKEMAIHELSDRIQNNSSKDAQRATREHR